MDTDDTGRVVLGIAPEKVGFIIIKAREFDAKVEVDDPESGSNAIDNGMTDILEDRRDDATADELRDAIDALNEEEQVNLVALAWLGRGDAGKDDWDDMLREAQERHNDRTSDYLLGIPLLSDFLEEGLDKLDFAIEDAEETDRL